MEKTKKKNSNISPKKLNMGIRQNRDGKSDGKQKRIKVKYTNTIINSRKE
jgi:FKBP-type peptidyl-prolyl cis-trans isomerase